MDSSDTFLKAQTSREVAEVIALLRAATSMRVVELECSEKITQKEFLEIIKSDCPVVFRGYAKSWDCVKKWNTEGYLLTAAKEEAESLPHRKYRQFTAQSAEKGRLHLTDGKSKAKPVTIASFLEHTEDLVDENGLYMLGIHSVHSAGLSYCPVQRHMDDGENVAPLARDVPVKIPVLEWYADYLADEAKKTNPIPYDHQQFFLAKGYAFTDLHYDSYDNFYVAVSGNRKWTLACPAASRWLIDSGAGKLKSGSGCVPHQKIFPPGSPAQLYPFGVVELMPGDMLFVPACWWHLVESVPGAEDGMSSAFNFFFSKPPDDVFGEFQKRLAETDGMVGSIQTDARARMAAKKEGDDEVPESIQSPPSGVDERVWDQAVRVAVTHNLVSELETVARKINNYSIESWKNESLTSDVKNETVDPPLPSTPTRKAPTRRAAKTALSNGG
jgi:hypothetical protein